jgi:hypothetical protein
MNRRPVKQGEMNPLVMLVWEMADVCAGLLDFKGLD